LKSTPVEWSSIGRAWREDSTWLSNLRRHEIPGALSRLLLQRCARGQVEVMAIDRIERPTQD
jgi:hypothetical protein